MKYKGITITKNKNCNTWYARYRKNGKQFYVSAKTQKECYDKLKLALKTANKESKQKAKPITIREWYNKWLELYKQNVKPVTIGVYEKSLKHLKPILNKPMEQITTIEVIELLNQIQFSRAKQLTYELIKALFDKAEVNEIITKNIMLKIEKPKHKKTNGLAFSNEDENKLIKILNEKNLDIFLVCLYQGLRKGEILALTIEDVDFKNKTIQINKTINQNNEIDTTKNKQSNRIMPLFEPTIKILEKYKGTQGRLFNLSYNACEKAFNRLRKAYFNDKKYTIHSLRHTFITKCQELKIPLHIIQKWVGHIQGSDVTNKVYTHARETAELENITIFNEKLNSNSTHS